MKKIGLLGYGCYNPLTEHLKSYYFPIFSQIVPGVNPSEIIHISTQFLKGEVESIEQQFDLREVTHNKHRIIFLKFSNLKYFVENVLPKFDLIISVEPHWPFVLYINKYAREHNVKVVFIQHGTLEGKESKASSMFFERLKSVLNSRRVLKNYTAFLKNLLFFIFLDYKIVVGITKSIKKRSLGLSFPFKGLSAKYKYDELFLHSEDDMKKFIELTSYKADDIKILKSPDILNYEQFDKSKIHTSEEKYVIYIDDYSLELFGKFYNQFNDFVDFIIGRGYQFIFLPRHRDDEKVEINKLNKKIIFADKKSINKYIDNAAYVFGHISTLMLLPLGLNKKVYSLMTDYMYKDIGVMNNIEKFRKYNNFHELKIDGNEYKKKLII